MSENTPQGFVSQSGVVLRRNADPEGNVSLYLLLRSLGPVWVSVPGASRGRVRFGGSVEPLVWGNFSLYKGTRRFYLKSVDVKEDFWSLRASAGKIRTLLEWDRLLCLHLVPGHPCDEILGPFYWSSVLLKEGVLPEAAEWRFLRKWLGNWGLAPSLGSCASCGTALGDAYWTAEGLSCSRCTRESSGAFLPSARREMLHLAEECPTARMKEFFPASMEDPGFWKDGCRRMKAFFDFMK
ncbi:MAG: DNA repair protein RecO [Synergistales bacterium]|nr:DNA repair protein RecO [Synergistales bacterium]